jgi:pyruvate carboxylase subunit B
MFKKHSTTTIRNFDALNDINNIKYSGQCIVNAGLKHQATITMMELPPGCEGSEAHTPDFYMKVLRQILDSGLHFDSLCFKDASGTSCPSKVRETIRRAREMLGADMHIVFHGHETAGNGVAAYLAALEGGATGLDLAMQPVSGGTCQPDIITMWHALKGTDYDLGIDLNKIYEAEKVFMDCMKDYMMPPESRAVNPAIIFSPMPGGALTANTQMMRDNGTLDKFPLLIAEMENVVKKGGYGTSVTPVSQFYCQQAMANVMFGPWKKITEGYGKMVLGYFGKTPVAPDPEIVKIASEQLKLEPTTKTVLEINDANPKKSIEAHKQTLRDNGLEVTDENIFIVATCLDKGVAYLKGEAKLGIRKNEPAKTVSSKTSSNGMNVTLNGKTYSVKLDGNKATVNGKTYDFTTAELNTNATSAPAASGAGTKIVAPMNGTLVRFSVNSGDAVAKDQELFVVEAMKMEMPVFAPKAGTVGAINVTKGSSVVKDQEVLTLN